MSAKSARHFLILAAACLILPAAAAACPGCKEGLFDPGQLAQRLGTARGYAWSIGLLLLVPAGLLGGIAALVLRGHRRRRAAASPEAIDSVGLSR